MLQTLLLQISLLPIQVPPPQSEAHVAVHARFKALATDQARLVKESQLAKGCREDTRRTFTGQFEGYGPLGYVRVGKPNGMPTDMYDAEVHTFPVPALIIQPDKEVFTEEERRPRFVEPDSRRPLPPFSLTDQTGTTRNIDGLGGRVLILHFFNPTCPNIQTLPEIVRLQSLQSRFPFQVFPVAIGITHVQALVGFRNQNVETLPPEFQIFLFGKGRGDPRSTFKDFAISPTTYILDRKGQVAWRICGSIPGALTDKINHILSEIPTEEHSLEVGR